MKKAAKVYTVVALFGGGGLFSSGIEQAEFGWRGLQGSFKVVASVDSWLLASRVHEYLCPDSAAVTMDLFERHDYEAYHGHEPPSEWCEVSPKDLRALCPEGPDALITSAPCQGFSANLAEGKSKTPKYQALNRLTVRGLWLALEAWKDCLPRLVLFENVPRILTRGAALLEEIRALLRSYGYTFDERTHDAGELGGLAQTRKRYLLAVRDPKSTPAPVHLPEIKKLRGIGEVIGVLPCPIPGAKLPPMHQVPRGMHWLTALRLALIEPGRDWRALNAVQAYEVRWHPERGFWMIGALFAAGWRCPSGWDSGISVGRWAVDAETLGRAWSRETAYTVRGWDETSGAVCGSRGGATASGAAYVADPRPGREQGRHPVYGWDSPAGAVTGQDGPSCGAASVADPRPAQAKYNNAFRVIDLDERGVAVTGGTAPCAGGSAVADPRGLTSWRAGNLGVEPWDNTPGTVTCGTANSDSGKHVADPRVGAERHADCYRVTDWDATAVTVKTSHRVGGGDAAVADPMVRDGKHSDAFRPVDWKSPAGVVTGAFGSGAGGVSVADPRLGCAPRPGAYGVIGWDETSPLVAASVDVHAGTAAVADPRPRDLRGPSSVPALPGPKDRGAWVIVSPWDCWHRPCTTLEVAMLQGLPAKVRGKPLDLYALGLSDADARQIIGNGVPPPAAEAIGEEFGQALMEGDGIVPVRLMLGGRWVQPPALVAVA